MKNLILSRIIFIIKQVRSSQSSKEIGMTRNLCNFLFVPDASHVSLDSDISEFMPELQSLEALAALDVPLMSQDPPEVEQIIEEAHVQEDMARESKVRKRSRKGSKSSDGSELSRGLSLPLATGGEDFHLVQYYCHLQLWGLY